MMDINKSGTLEPKYIENSNGKCDSVFVLFLFFCYKSKTASTIK